MRSEKLNLVMCIQSSILCSCSPVMIWPTVAGTTTFWPGWIMVMLAPGLGPELTPEVRGRMLGPGLAELSRAGLMLVLTVGILEQVD